MQTKRELMIELRRTAATPAHVEPVSFGVPLAAGALRSTDRITVSSADGRCLPSQVATLARWPDETVRWALVDTVLPAGDGNRRAELIRLHLAGPTATSPHAIAVQKNKGHYSIDTGGASFEVSRHTAHPFVTMRIASSRVGMSAQLLPRLETDGCVRSARLECIQLETTGPVRATLRARGCFSDGRGGAFCRFEMRLSFFVGTALTRLDFTIHNPKRARHSGGVWDLGDAGSVLFRALSVDIRTPASVPYRLAWRTSPERQPALREGGRVEIFQASSGGQNWASRNHVDRTGIVPLPFRGCRVRYSDEDVESLDRASPVLDWIGGGIRIGAAITKFWQLFPSALEGGPDGLRVGLFPRQLDAPFELQGGEQKTHTIFFLIGDEDRSTDLGWVHDPLVPCIAPEHFATSGVFPHFVPAREDPHTDYLALADGTLDGPQSLIRKRERIDEYGWRNFGDSWADHEDAHFDGERPVVSHYNNQYDLLYGLLLHFARTADPRWFELATDMARHVIDIDLYHTCEDKPAYNGGQFWHTVHYQDAGRATHRSFTADSPLVRLGRAYGGGPSSENNYTTGLLYFHYFTGDPSARDSVVQLADWVSRMDDGAQSLLGHLAPGPTGLASRTREDDYHGPGRGGGNSVNALLDAWHLTGDDAYLGKGEELIARCIHPYEDPARHELRDAERRWSYLVFLQTLGKYLDLKSERGETDLAFRYARASLLHYARWMLDNEVPFLSRAEQLEYPTESWPAQDVRKSCIFDYAAKYGPPELRQEFVQKAELYFDESLRGVRSFETRGCTRPVAVLLGSGSQRAAFRLHPPAPLPATELYGDIAPPVTFRSQKERAKRQLRTLRGILRLAVALSRPSVLKRLASRRIW